MAAINAFSVGGIRVRIDQSWFIAFFLFAWTLSSGYFPLQVPDYSAFTYWIAGTISSLGLFACVLLHELSHCLAARRQGVRLEGAAKTLGTAVEVIYTTRKGIDAEPVDYWHVFGEGARGAWKPPTLVHDPKLAGDPLAFRGGSYRVTERGIVG